MRVAPNRKVVASDLRRFGGYAFWAGADQTIAQGIPRLVLFPILAAMLGESAFGTFVIALGLVQIVGLSPSNGLTAYLIRDMTREDAGARPLMIRTAMCLSLLVVGPIALAFVFASGKITHIYGDNADLGALLPGLAVFLVLTNLVETCLAAQRVERRFHLIALVHTVQTGFLFSAIPLARTFGLKGVAGGFVIATAAALAGVLFVNPDLLHRGPILSRRHARAALSIWLPFSLSSFITLSAGYLDRVLLGYWWTPADVAPFFAAVSTAAIFIVPSTFMSNLTLSLLGKVKRRERFDRKFYTGYLTAAAAFAVIVFGLGLLVGPLMLRLLYSDFLADATPLWTLAIAAFAIMNLQVFTRPFVCKFLPPGFLPMLSGIGLTARLVPLFLLVPTGGAAGAVTALLIGSVITSIVWVAAFVKGFILTAAARPADELCDQSWEG